jgi:Torus domain
MLLKIKEGTGSVLMTMEVNRNTPIADIIREIHEVKKIPIEKISLLQSSNVPLDLDRLFEHYNCPKEIFLATELWFSYYSEEDQKEYYLNPNTSETQWDLPLWAKSVPGPLGDDLGMVSIIHPHEKHAKYSHLLRPSDWLEGTNYKKRTARKQLEKPYIREFAYKQGDEEYNIWFDKYLNDCVVRERQPASTKCDPEKDIGYTKGDIYEPHTSYWCLHFVRGCCSEGANCNFFHHMPSLADCNRIAPIKDIFGRSRHANHREDMGGIGCFQKECRTLYVGDLKIPPGEDPVEQLNEMLWRHFSLWGRVEDITLIPQKCVAFIKYYHRCYAEIAKEAMSNQSLDFDEMISIKWANDDPDPKKESQYSELWHKKQIQIERENKGKKLKNTQNKKKEDPKEPDKLSYTLPKKLPPPINASELEKRFKKDVEEQEKINNDMKRLEGILNRIHHEQPETLAEIIFPSCLDESKVD